ncbi:MAG: hypothetical protein ABSG53_02855 [Thermoguttaceae bacterium]|jgi:hypothetical protein
MIRVAALLSGAAAWLAVRWAPRLLAKHPKAAEIVMKSVSAFHP